MNTNNIIKNRTNSKNMSEIIKNNVTGLYNLKIGNTVFESKVADYFAIDSKEIENVLINTLPLNVDIELTKTDQCPELHLKRIDDDLVDIILYEVEGWVDLPYVSHYFYNELKEEIIRAVDSGKTKMEFHDIDHDGDLFEYAIRFSAITVGEAFQRAMEIDEFISGRMIQVGEQGAKYMRLVANGAWKIDVFPDNNSKV